MKFTVERKALVKMLQCVGKKAPSQKRLEEQVRLTGGCETAMLNRLLADLEKPFCCRPDRVYYHWPSRSWCLPPTPPEELDTDRAALRKLLPSLPS